MAYGKFYTEFQSFGQIYPDSVLQTIIYLDTGMQGSISSSDAINFLLAGTPLLY